ncbi:MAG: glycoside hydrolase family 9 protein [Cyclobacteriaceae bacterium]
MKKIVFAFLLFSFQIASAQNNQGESVRLNQIGFYPESQKIAVVINEKAAEFYITKANNETRLFAGKLSEVKNSYYSSRKTKIANFSAFTSQGEFVLHVAGVGSSFPFGIKDKIHDPIVKASLKGFYFQRFSTELTKEYAGVWSRPTSSSNEQILIHPSAASKNRPAGTIITSPRGWIDAGDYNKYIVNSGITTSTLLSAYEDFPEYYGTLDLNIPESKNEIPDILDEIIWNLRWMLTMQDPDDGGVYHKCTNANFDPMVMPHEATTPRYMVQKSTAAALNFTAVASQASRILKKFNKQLPGLSDSCINAAKRAWMWAKQNPSVIYNQDKMNQQFDPDITTGAYGDNNFSDEFIWAAAEMAVATGDATYMNNINFQPDATNPIPSWNQVRLLGYFTLIKHGKNFGSEQQLLIESLKKRIIQKADELVVNLDKQPYRTVMGINAKDFVWGSNAVAANQGILLLEAYRINLNEKYISYALSNLDYILGRNATGYSFVTGYGDRTPMHIHHRPSEADGIKEPVPGLLAGGPNPGMQDKCTYTSSIADEAFVDDVCSYASNEIAINWNAPLVYLSGAIEALMNKK